MFTFLVCVGVVLILVLSAFLLVILFKRAAENKQHASFVAENTIEYVVTGENYFRTLANVDGQILTKSGKIMDPLKTSEEREPIGFIDAWLRDKWGFYWVSFFYPWRKIHKWNISAERLKGATERKPGTKIRDMIERDKELKEVDHVRATIPRPFAVEGIETKENFRLDLLVFGLFRTIDGRPMAFKLKETFFEALKSVIEAATNDYIKGLDYAAFLASEKGKGSTFSDGMKKRLESLVEDFGLEVIDIWIEAYELVSGDDVLKATQAKKLAELKGTADVDAADFRLKAAEKDAKALAASVLELGKAYKANEDVAHYINAERVTQNLAQGRSNLTTLVMGQGVIPTLPIGGSGTSSPTPAPTPTPTTGP